MGPSQSQQGPAASLASACARNVPRHPNTETETQDLAFPIGFFVACLFVCLGDVCLFACFLMIFLKHMILSDSACCGTVPLSAPHRTKIQVLYCSSTGTDTGVVGKFPCRGGRGGTAFGKQYHLADVSTDIIISEVIRVIWHAPKGQLGQRYLHAIFKQMGYRRILL